MKKLLLALLLFLSACEASVGSSSKTDSENDNSVNTTITTISSGEGNAVGECAKSFLWKPVSESDGNLVVLFPKGFTYFDVTAQDLEGNFEPGVLSGYTNGARQTWRFSRPGEEYTGELIADECDWTVEDPSKRTESLEEE